MSQTNGPWPIQYWSFSFLLVQSYELGFFFLKEQSYELVDNFY